jgi:hypothetical protein
VFALPNHRSDLDGDGIDDAVEQALAERFAPVICMDPGEPNYPVNVEWFLARARLTYYEDCWPDVNEDVPGAAMSHHPNHPDQATLGTAAQLLGPPWRHPFSGEQLDNDCHCGGPPDHGPIATDEPDPDRFTDQTTFILPDLDDDDQIGSLQPADWTTYAHIYPVTPDLVAGRASLARANAPVSQSLLGGMVIQYWHLFAYNGYGFATAGHHGGDWDACIHVVLDATLEPVGVVFSRHSDDSPGDFFSWADVSIYQGTHPIICIDGGGHAAFRSVDDADSYGHHGGISFTSDPDHPSPDYSGTIWKTWSGGGVTQHGACDHAIVGHVSGPLINLGEYNPGVKQAAALCQGECNPLNGQEFIRYSGRWGSISKEWGTPPRGPVFQGYDDSRDSINLYWSWYWLGSDAPAAAGTHSWCVPPRVSARTDANGAVELSATQNATAAKFGAARMFYAFADPDADEPDEVLFSPSHGRLFTGVPIAVPAGKRVGYTALDGLNNVSPPGASGAPALRQVQFVVMGKYHGMGLPEIQYIAGKWSDGAIWYVSREQAVADIQHDAVHYYVRRGDGEHVPLVVDHSTSRNGPGVYFVRTTFDDTKADNLLSLPHIQR